MLLVKRKLLLIVLDTYEFKISQSTVQKSKRNWSLLLHIIRLLILSKKKIFYYYFYIPSFNMFVYYKETYS